VKPLGHKDVPGRPTLYGTTKTFLDYFNLKSLNELPTLAEIRDLDQYNPEFAFDQSTGAVEDAANTAVAGHSESSGGGASIEIEAEDETDEEVEAIAN
jgi:segregation and condensation protein B